MYEVIVNNPGGFNHKFKLEGQFKYRWAASFKIWQLRFIQRHCGVSVEYYDIVKV